jgi:uncharacterized repeat protein (TIGR01451 family)
MKNHKRIATVRAFAVLLLTIGTMMAHSVSSQAVTSDGLRPFVIRYEGAFRGDLILIGNNLLACVPGSLSDVHSTPCEVAQSSLDNGRGIDNNVFDMRHVDIDGDATTFNSSRAVLNLPAGAQVVFAGLYWGAFSDINNVSPNPARASVKLRAPGSAGYTSLIASQVDDIYISGQGNAYQGFADVTTQVKAAGPGAYTIADVLAVEGTNRYAGWAMVVAYSLQSESLRNLVVYDGFKFDPEFKPISIPLSGFLTPATGPVSVTLGVYGSDGDRGNPGDQLLLNSTVISDAINPANNPFNSSISNRGVNVTSRTPAALNNMNIDIDLFDASNIIPNNAATATLVISATQEKFLPALATFSTLVFQPAIQVETRVNDLNGGDVIAGDTLEYTIILTNTGEVASVDSRMKVTLPAGAAHVPNTLNIVSNAGGATGAQTDAAGDDLAEVSGGTLFVRLGTGANASAGGDIAVNNGATVKYQVKVANTIASQLLSNRADVTYRSIANPSVVLTSTSTLNLTAFAKNRMFLPIINRQ